METMIGFAIIANISTIGMAIIWYLEKNGKVKIPLLHKGCLDVNPVLGTAMNIAGLYGAVCVSVVLTELLYGFVALCKIVGNIFI